jgi:hypothetical protein
MDVLATNSYFVLVLDLSFANGDVELKMVSSNSGIKWEFVGSFEWMILSLLRVQARSQIVALSMGFITQMILFLCVL